MSRQNAVSSVEPGVLVLHSNRMEVLCDTMISLLQASPLDPLETDIIAVQSNGIAQWLRGRIALGSPHGSPGIAAALDTPMPSRLMWSLYRRVLGEESVPEFSPLDKQPLVWRLMRLLGNLAGDQAYEPLQRFLQDDPDLRKRHQLALRLADLFDQYQVYRADWLADWAAGNDVLRGAGQARALDADQCWQAALWREILTDVGPEGRVAGRAVVHARFIHTLRTWQVHAGEPDLPRRIVVFGVSSLPRQALEALVEVGRWTQVLVCVHNPCKFHWADIVEGRTLLRRVTRRRPMRPGMPEELDFDQLHAHAHPLLASWGRQGRDYLALLEELEDERTTLAAAAEADANPVNFQMIEAFAGAESASMLEQVQADILHLESVPAIRGQNRVLSDKDRSICFHVAHSPMREVEILHDQLLAAFDADRTLQPDDVIVMVPDIEKYAPYIDAVFGLYTAGDSRRLPYFIVDRGPGSVNTVLDAVTRLLSLPQARLGVGEVLDLLDIVAVRRRFGLNDQDLAVMRDWITGANVRWGLDSGHREGMGVAMHSSLSHLHTWEFGLKRMLLGYAMGDGAEWNGIAPFGDVAGLEARLAGSLDLVIQRMSHHARALATPATPAQWVQRLSALLDDFIDDGEDVAAFTVEQLRQALDDWLDECEAAGFEEALSLSVVTRHWLSCFQSTGLAQRFTSGAITFATLMPMRAIPFRHVCLLGMNDGDYPRARMPTPFDLMQTDYRPGDRSRRDDDRYLFLEALLSARERFYVSWVGRSIVDNTERPPSVLVAQLRDHLAAGWHSEGRPDEVLARITTVHPLQAFSGAYFVDPTPDARLFTYAREWRGAPATEGATSSQVTGSLPALQREEPLSFHELESFLKHPVVEFFQQRLDVKIEESEAPSDEEMFLSDRLSTWGLYDALIRACAGPLAEQGDVMARCDAELARMERSGQLAFGVAGKLESQECRASFQKMVDDWRTHADEWPEVDELGIEVSIGCDGTPGLAGWLGPLRRRSDGAVLRLEMQASRMLTGRSEWSDRNLVGHWVRHLAANSQGHRLTTIVLSPAGSPRFEPVEPAQASAWLDAMLQAWGEGMRRPLPFKAEFANPVLSSLGYAPLPAPGTDEWRAWVESDALTDKIAKCFEESWNQAGRREAVYERRAYPTLDSLCAGDELITWIVRLFSPLFTATRAKGKGKGKKEGT